MGGDSLAALRGEIDRIDAAMHDLLMERGAIIDRLIAAKRSAPTASAFRPDREAAMLRGLAERHAGSLPLDAVEGIWRVIISTFTYAQAPFTVHGDAALGADSMRDSARFHFGFTVPYRAWNDAAGVIAAVGDAAGDLGLIGFAGPSAEPWWRLLEPLDAPKAIARLPFLPRPAHPTPLPVLVIARSAPDTVGESSTLFSIRLRERRSAGEGLDVLAAAGGSALVAAAPRRAEALAALCDGPPIPVGGYPEPYAPTG